MQIKYPLSFGITFGVMIITAGLSVSWHPLLVLLLLVDLAAIAMLPAVARHESKLFERMQAAADSKARRT